jgi:hypothetical protein
MESLYRLLIPTTGLTIPEPFLRADEVIVWRLRMSVLALTDSSGASPFLWGAASAAHQDEGNNINPDLWVMENIPGDLR